MLFLENLQVFYSSHEVFGFKYWKDPGAFSNGALGVVNAFVLASFSMQGTEIVGITAGECSDPVKVTISLFILVENYIYILCLTASTPCYQKCILAYHYLLPWLR